MERWKQDDKPDILGLQTVQDQMRITYTKDLREEMKNPGSVRYQLQKIEEKEFIELVNAGEKKSGINLGKTKINKEGRGIIPVSARPLLHLNNNANHPQKLLFQKVKIGPYKIIRVMNGKIIIEKV